MEEGPEGGRKGDEEEVQEDLRGGGSGALRVPQASQMELRVQMTQKT